MAVGGPGFFITGIEAATGKLTRKAATVLRDSVQTTDEAARAVEQLQRATAPVDSGETRSSIVNTSEWANGEYRRKVGPTHFVARFLVYGTVNMSRKWELHGAVQPAVESWMSEMAKVGEL